MDFFYIQHENFLKRFFLKGGYDSRRFFVRICPKNLGGFVAVLKSKVGTEGRFEIRHPFPPMFSFLLTLAPFLAM